MTKIIPWFMYIFYYYSIRTVAYTFFLIVCNYSWFYLAPEGSLRNVDFGVFRTRLMYDERIGNIHYELPLITP